MIGLDTNVLVRYIVRDGPPGQIKAATTLIEKRCTPEKPGWINRIVFCELVWVLESAYEYPRTLVAQVIGRLLTVAEFSIEDSDLVRDALRAYAAGFDFADSLLGLSNTRAGCETTYTLDRRAARLPYFKISP